MLLRVIILLFILVTPCLAAEQATTDFLQLLNGMHSMKAGFQQTQYEQHGKLTQKSYGQMAMARPDKFRWDITRPQPQLIIARNNKLWIYDPDLAQLTIRSLDHASGETPILLLSHDNANLEKQFFIKTIKKNQPGWQWYDLRARNKDSLFSHMEMGFQQQHLQEMHLQDNLGHATVIRFSNVQVNASLPASLFMIKPAPNVDVIDETGK